MSKRIRPPTAIEREQEITILDLRSQLSIVRAKLAAKNKQERRRSTASKALPEKDRARG
jgi:hypothetical protein